MNNSGLNCGIQDYGGGAFPGNTGGSFPVRMAYDFVGYFSPGGFFAKIGRISQDEGRNADGVALGGAQANGIQLGFKNANWYGYVFPNEQADAAYNIALGSSAVNTASGLAAGAPTVGQCPFGNPGNSAAATANGYISAAIPAGMTTSAGPPANLNNCITKGTDGIAAMLEYYNIPSRTAIGVTYDGYNNVQAIGWNPYAGLCVGSLAATGTGLGTTTTPGAGQTTWNTAVVGNNGYCPTGRPLVQPAGSANAGSPVTGAYQSVPTNIHTGSLYLIQYLGNSAVPQFRLTLEGLNRFGNDPFSAAQPLAGGGTAAPSAWSGKGSAFFEAAFASKGNWNGGPLFPASGLRNSNVVVFQYYNQGFNSISLDNGVTGTGAFDSAQQYLGNYAGMKWANIYLSHWFTNNFRAGLTYYTLQNSMQIPAGSTTCPGCSVGSFVMHSLGTDIFLSL